ALLVEKILAEAPEGGGSRVAPILNGLGRTKYEELFVLWGRIVPLLEEAGLELVGPQVGELVTSLDMAGLSLTLTWLDEDLERLWLAPCDTPAFKLGSLGARGGAEGPRGRHAAEPAPPVAGPHGAALAGPDLDAGAAGASASEQAPATEPASPEDLAAAPLLVSVV